MKTCTVQYSKSPFNRGKSYSPTIMLDGFDKQASLMDYFSVILPSLAIRYQVFGHHTMRHPLQQFFDV